MKKFLAAFLLIILAASCSYASYWDEGNSGYDEANAYIIDTAADLVDLRQRVNNGTENNGAYYRLEKNISLLKNYTDWEPIGTESYPFTGHFDGNGKTIRVNIDRGSGEASLFGTIKTVQSYAIKNLAVSGTVKARLVGGIALNLYNALIEGCSFSGTLSGLTYGGFYGVEYGKESTYAGGIVKTLSSGTIKDCSVENSTITSNPSPVASVGYAGGIAANMLDGTIEKCYVNEIIINGTTNLNDGEFNSPTGVIVRIGGIVGGTFGGIIADNEAYTESSGFAEKLYIGGVIGEIEDDSELTIENNLYGGTGFGYGIGCDMYGEATDEPGCIRARSGTEDDPIIIDSLTAITTLREQINSNAIQTGNTYYKLTLDLTLTEWEAIGTNDNPFTGHFDGDGHKITVSGNSSLFGNVKTESGYAVKNLTVNGTFQGRFVAGIVLNLHSGSIEDCVFTGRLKASTAYDADYGKTDTYSGGIVEHVISGTIKNCIVKEALITSTPTCDYYAVGYVGGIAARMDNGTIDNCLTSEDVTIAGFSQFIRDLSPLSKIRIGGIAGAITKGTVSNNKSYAGVHGWGDEIRLGKIIGELEGGANPTISNNQYTCNEAPLEKIDGEYIGNNEMTILARYGIGRNAAGIATDEPGCAYVGPGSTEDNPFIIDSVAALQTLSNKVNSKSNVDGLYYRLTKDLSLGAWGIIGTDDDTPFTGHFDGNNHTIEIDHKGGVTSFASLFGSIKTQNGYAVKNLNVTGILQGHAAAGIVISLLDGTIENCSFTGKIIAYAPFEYASEISVYWQSTFAGGIAAVITSGTIKNCKVENSIILSNPYYVGAFGYVGGIASRMLGGSIENCVVSEGNMIYGISQHQMQATVFDQHAAEINAGGIVGEYLAGNLKDNEAYSEVHSWSDSGNFVGGVIGKMSGGSSSLTITNNKYTALAKSLELDDENDEKNPVQYLPLEIVRDLIIGRCRRVRVLGKPEDTVVAVMGIGRNSEGEASDDPGCINVKPSGIKPAILSNKTLTSAKVGENYSFTLEAEGTALITWNLKSGNLPNGLELDDKTGKISGTPTAAGTFTFVIKASNSFGYDEKEFSLTVAVNGTKPTIKTGATLKNATYKASYSVTLKAEGTTPITWKLISGTTLPDGLKLTKSSGKISGNPKTTGTFKFKIRAANSIGYVNKTFTLTIGKKPSITTSELTDGINGITYTQTLKASGTKAITWSKVSGTLPKGLTLKASSGKITGIPTKAGTFTFTVRAENDYGQCDKNLTITIGAVPEISTGATLKAGIKGEKYNTTLKAKGTAPITWKLVSGTTLPNGLKLTKSSGKISGTPTKTGTFKFKVKASNVYGYDTKTFTLKIAKSSSTLSINEVHEISEVYDGESIAQEVSVGLQAVNNTMPEVNDDIKISVNKTEAELQVINDDGEPDYGLVKISVGQDLLFELDLYDEDIPGAKVYVNGEALDMKINEDGTFILDGRESGEDFKVCVKYLLPSGEELTTNEIYIVIE